MVSRRAASSFALCSGSSRSHVAAKDGRLRLGQILQNCPSLLRLAELQGARLALFAAGL